eukprot:GSChrysophyteH1.ASY1.ANO1.850.1 assembled CDS
MDDYSRSVVITGLFWSSSVLLKRVVGAIGVHAGRSYPFTVCVGLLSTSISTLIAHYNADGIMEIPAYYNVPKIEKLEQVLGSRSKKWKTPSFWNKSEQSKVDAKKFYLTLLIFISLERRGFRTALPSSLLTVGAYAPNALSHPFTNGVATYHPVATTAQRYTMQRLGSVHGCHHCGNRQTLLRMPFIADHMPPSKMVQKANKKWYRNLPISSLSWPAVKQRLFPQCQSCFSKQGGAVRAGIHTLVYGSPLRSWVLAPSISCYGEKLRMSLSLFCIRRLVSFT